MIFSWFVNPMPKAMPLRSSAPLHLVALWILQASLNPAGLAAETAPPPPANNPPAREVEVFPFLKDGSRRNTTGEPAEGTAGTPATSKPASGEAPGRPSSAGYLNRLGVPGGGSLRFDDASRLVEEAIPLPEPAILRQPLLTASLSRGPMEWEGHLPIPLKPITRVQRAAEANGVGTAAGSAAPSSTAPAPTSRTPASVRVEAGATTTAATTPDPAAPNPGGARQPNDFQSIAPFFQVSPWPQTAAPSGTVLQFATPDSRPAMVPTLKSRAVYETK